MMMKSGRKWERTKGEIDREGEGKEEGGKEERGKENRMIKSEGEGRG